VAAPGLRERKKAETKNALSRAAVELALQRGLDAVTAEAIAQAANVSARTFHNYFPSKERAILFMLEDAVHLLVEAFFRRSESEPVLDALEASFLEVIESVDQVDRMVAVTRLIAEHPALIAHHLAVYNEASNTLLAEIGRRTGTDPDRDLYPRLVYQAASAVAPAAVEMAIRSASSREVADIIRDGFDQLRRGLPQPASTLSKP
jgi:AcrR family transcriptional regulator